MTIKPNLPKLLYWCMVLATVAVLIWITYGPTGFTALEHAPKGARVKRRLRLNLITTEESNGDDDDREHTFSTLDHAVMTIKITTDSEPVAGAVKTNAELQDGTTKIDDSTQSLFERARLLEWYNSRTQENPTDNGIAVMDKISELLTLHGTKRVLSMIAAEINVPATQEIAKILEKALVVKYMDENRDDDFFEMLIAGKKDATEFLASPFLETWINLYPQRRKGSPYPPLYKELKKYYSEPALAQQLRVAQGNSAAKKTARELANHQMVIWDLHEYSGDVVFERLGLKVAGIDMFNSPVWDTWVSYLVWLDVRKPLEEPEKAKLVVSALRNVAGDVLVKSIAAAKTAKGKRRAKALVGALTPEESALLRKELQKRPLKNDDEASTSTKVQRNDDGQ